MAPKTPPTRTSATLRPPVAVPAPGPTPAAWPVQPIGPRLGGAVRPMPAPLAPRKPH
jgi:hypothetical protein